MPGFIYQILLTKILVKKKKNKIFTIKEQIYELIKDTKRKKIRISKAMLVSNNIKLLKKKNWRLPISLASYIPSKFKKKASSYIYWFNRVFFEKFLKQIRLLPTKLQKKFKFLRGFRFYFRSKKKKKSYFLYKNMFWKLFYIKAKLLFQQQLKKKVINVENLKFKKLFISKKSSDFVFSCLRERKINILLFNKNKQIKYKKKKQKLKVKVNRSFFKFGLNFWFFTTFFNFIFNFTRAHAFNFFSFVFKNTFLNCFPNKKNKQISFSNFQFFKKLKNVRKRIKKYKHFKLGRSYTNKKYLLLNKKKCKQKSLVYFKTFLKFLNTKKRVFNSCYLPKSSYKILQKFYKKTAIFFKNSQVFMKRYYKRFFDFYPNESYSFVDKNLGEFKLTSMDKNKYFNIINKKNNINILQQKLFSNFVTLLPKNQFLNTEIFRFFSFSYTLLNFLRFNETRIVDFLALQKNIVLFDLLQKKQKNRILKTRFQYSYFKLQQRNSVPGKIVFTLNSNTIFLTVSDPKGITLLQSSTGSVSKILKTNKPRKEIKPGYGFKRRKIARQIKIRRMIKDFTKGKTKKMKKKFITQMSRRQKGKRRFKTKSKTKFISQDFIKPLFFLLETFLFRVRNLQARKQLLKKEKLKLKLKAKLFKLKKADKKKTKTYKDIKKKIREIQIFKNKKFYHKNSNLKQKNIIKFLFPLKKKFKKSLQKKQIKKNWGLVKLIEKLRFANKLKKNWHLSLGLKKQLVKISKFKFLSPKFGRLRKDVKFETFLRNVYMKVIKKKYVLLNQKNQNFFDLIFFNKARENRKQHVFFEKIKTLKYNQTFFSSYVLYLKNFSIATIRRIFIYTLKMLLRKTRLLKKNLKKKINFYVNRLYVNSRKIINES